MLKSAQATAVSVKFVNNITIMATLWLKDVITEQNLRKNTKIRAHSYAGRKLLIIRKILLPLHL